LFLRYNKIQPKSRIGKQTNFAGAGLPWPLFLLGLGRVEAFLPQALGHIWAEKAAQILPIPDLYTFSSETNSFVEL
jgi:hypothetical protein